MDFDKYLAPQNFAKYAYKSEAYIESRKQYFKEQAELTAQFEQDVIAECGLTDHPKADKAYSMAYELADGCFEEIYNYLLDLADLMT